MRIALTLVLLVISTALFANVEVHQFKTPADEARYRVLTEELRCLVCQNQNLADSDADLAKDLRQEVYQMVLDDKSNKQIKGYLVARYGDFVLYKPPFKLTTVALWLGPLVLLIGGFIGLLLFVRKRKTVTSEKLSDEEKQRAEDMLNSNQG